MLKLLFPQNQSAKGPHCNLLPRSPQLQPHPGVHTLAQPPPVAPGCLIECYRNDGTPLPDQLIKTQWLQPWVFSLSCSLVSHSGRSHVSRNLAVRSTNKEQEASAYMSELRNRHPPPRPSWSSDDWNLADPQLSCSWISDPQKSWDNVCCFQTGKFGVTWSAATDTEGRQSTCRVRSSQPLTLTESPPLSWVWMFFPKFHQKRL